MSLSPTQGEHSHSQPSTENGKQHDASITPISPTSQEYVVAVENLSISGTAANCEQLRNTTLADWVNTASSTDIESIPNNPTNTTNGGCDPSLTEANNAVGNASHPTSGSNSSGTPNATNNPLAATVSPMSASPPELHGGQAPNARPPPLVIHHVDNQAAARGPTPVTSPTTPNFVQPHQAQYAMHAGGTAQVAAGVQYHHPQHPLAPAPGSVPQPYAPPGMPVRAQGQAAMHQAGTSNGNPPARGRATTVPHVRTSHLTAEQSMALTSGMYDVLHVKLHKNSAQLDHLFQWANTLKSHIDSLHDQLRQAAIYKDRLGGRDEVATKMKTMTRKLDELTRECEQQKAVFNANANAITAHSRQSSGLRALISSVATDMSVLRQEVNGLHGGCREQFQILSGRLVPGLGALDQRVNDVEFATQCNEKSLVDANREFSDLQASFAAVQSEVTNVQKNLSDLANSFESLKTDVHTTELNSEDAASDARKTKEAIEPLRADLATVQEELKRAQDNFAHLQTTVTQLQDEVAQAKTQAKQVDEHLAQVQTDSSQVRQDLEKVRGRVNHFGDESNKMFKLLANIETKVNKRLTAIEHHMVDYEIAQRKELDAMAAQQRKAFGAFTAQQRREFDNFVIDQRNAMRRMEERMSAQKGVGAYAHNDRMGAGDKRKRDGG